MLPVLDPQAVGVDAGDAERGDHHVDREFAPEVYAAAESAQRPVVWLREWRRRSGHTAGRSSVILDSRPFAGEGIVGGAVQTALVGAVEAAFAGAACRVATVELPEDRRAQLGSYEACREHVGRFNGYR